MAYLTRRNFCSTAAAVAASAAVVPGRAFAQALGTPESPTSALSLKIGGPSAQTVPADFMGFSYESGQLAYPDFFSSDNHDLVGLFRTLSPSGVLRLGGNLSEFTIWSEAASSTPPEAGGLVGPDPGHREPRTFAITPTAIRNLKAFLDATNWRCIYGLNLGGGTLEQALAEGGFVSRTLGPRLICVQFGNEPDLFKHRDQPGNSNWTYEEFLSKWKTFRAAFHDKLPNVPVAGPDTAYKQDWFGSFAKDVSQKEVALLTSHYYTGGPPSNPEMTTEFLLHPGARFEDSCAKAIRSAKAAGIPFRMAEGNTCYNAGKPGVSDTFASALWAADFCLSLASLGCVGVNLHGGANGFYSPIVGSTTAGFTARPEYYGLLLAQHFSGLTLHAAALQTGGANLTAYAAGENGSPRHAVVFNKDASPALICIECETKLSTGIVHRLLAPALDSKDGVTLGSANVSPSGHFDPHTRDSLTAQQGKLLVPIPAYSAALVHLT